MKGIVRLSVILSLCLPLAKTDAGSKDEQSKQTFNANANAIGSHHKPDLLSYQQITQYGDKQQPEQIVYHQQRYQPRTQHLQQATPYQHQQEPLMRKPNLIPQHQPMPVAMVIIAQPAYIPASMLQNGNVAQQILNYFHGNSQARYQYIPIRNPQHQYIPVPVQSQHISQYVHYQPQQEIVQSQPSAPAAEAQSTQFYPDEALPTPQALISSHHRPQHEAIPTPQALISTQQVVPHHEALPSPQALISSQHIPHHFSQQNIVEGRVLQYNTPQQQNQYHYGQSHRQVQQLVEPQQNEDQQLQQEEQPQPGHQKPLQLTDISQLAQQAAQHFLMNGGLQSGSRTAPAIITGLEHFSPEQQEKIKKQLGVHFGSPLKPLNFSGEQGQTEQKSSTAPNKYYQDQKQRQKTQKFVPSIQVKDGEITQSTSGSGKM